MKLTAALIAPALSMSYPLIKKRWFAKLQFRSLHIKQELFPEYFTDTARIAKDDMVAFLQENARYCLKDSLTRCKAKVLVLVGSRERPIMKRSAKLLAARLPDARLEVLPQYGHGDLSINHSRQYAEKLLQLIDGR